MAVPAAVWAAGRDGPECGADTTVIVPDGHTPTQAPQPVQSSLSRSGWGTAPSLGWNRMARTSQASSQQRHSIPERVKHFGPMRARFGQGVDGESTSKSPSGQTSAQVPQNVQPPRPKSIEGSPPSPMTMIFSGQESTQSLQRVQPEWRSCRDRNHGKGRGRSVLNRPRSQFRLWMSMETAMKPLSGFSQSAVRR